MRRAGLALAIGVALATGAHGGGLEAARGFTKALARTGRAEATLRYALPAMPGAKPRVVEGRLALEPPDLVRLDVPATGERLVARGNGGEWLQPATKQLLRFGPRQVAPALRWWRALLGDSSLVRERRLGDSAFGLAMRQGAGVADTATVWLDSRGLPARLEVGSGEDAVTYRLGGWRFTRPKGTRGFRLTAPPGFETVELR